MSERSYLSPSIASIVLEDYRQDGTSAELSVYSVLTDRECEALQLLAEGLTTKETASRMHLSVKTVETHRARLMERLDIRDIPGLVRIAIREGLISR